MDQGMLKRHLALAEEHIAQAERKITRQRQLIGELERAGHSSIKAKALLAQLEVCRAMHFADRDRVLKELSD